MSEGQLCVWIEPSLNVKLTELSLQGHNPIMNLLPQKLKAFWERGASSRGTISVAAPFYFWTGTNWFIGAIAMRREFSWLYSGILVGHDEPFMLGNLRDQMLATRRAEEVFTQKLSNPTANDYLNELMYGKPVVELTKIEIQVVISSQCDTLQQGEPKK